MSQRGRLLRLASVFFLVASACGSSTPVAKTPVEPPAHKEPAPPPKPPEPPPPPQCSTELASAFAIGKKLHAIVNDGTEKRCMELRTPLSGDTSNGMLRHTYKFSGNEWSQWTRTFFMSLVYQRVDNTLQLSWAGAGSTFLDLTCHNGPVRRSAMGFVPKRPAPPCGGKRTVKSCDADSIQFDDGALYLSQTACEKALSAGAAPLSLGTCDAEIAAKSAEARKAPEVPAAAIEGAKKLQSLLGSKRKIYLVDKEEKTWCGKAELRPGKSASEAELRVKYRKKRRKMISHTPITLRGIALRHGLTRHEDVRKKTVTVTSGGGGACWKVSGAGKKHIEFGNGVAFYTDRRACKKAVRAAKKAAKRAERARRKAARKAAKERRRAAKKAAREKRKAAKAAKKTAPEKAETAPAAAETTQPDTGETVAKQPEAKPPEDKKTPESSLDAPKRSTEPKKQILK